ncbi:hypothetical protein [Dyella subtropica]|nr:hypothetical protein [Dyella subtropica]
MTAFPIAHLRTFYAASAASVCMAANGLNNNANNNLRFDGWAGV